MKHRELYLDCLRRPVEAWRHGTFDRWQTVAFMASCIDVHMRKNPATEPEYAGPRSLDMVPALELEEPLSADDQVLQELYDEAAAFWVAGYGRLRLIK